MLSVNLNSADVGHHAAYQKAAQTHTVGQEYAVIVVMGDSIDRGVYTH